MKQVTIVLGLVFATATASLFGCTSAEAVAERSSALDTTILVGKYAFVYEDPRKQVVEAQLASTIADPVELARAKREAADEARKSEIELTADGWFVSRIDGREILRATYAAIPGEAGGFDVTVRVDGKNETTHVDVAGDRIVMNDARKGPLAFVRTR